MVWQTICKASLMPESQHYCYTLRDCSEYPCLCPFLGVLRAVLFEDNEQVSARLHRACLRLSRTGLIPGRAAGGSCSVGQAPADMARSSGIRWDNRLGCWRAGSAAVKQVGAMLP